VCVGDGVCADQHRRSTGQRDRLGIAATFDASFAQAGDRSLRGGHRCSERGREVVCAASKVDTAIIGEPVSKTTQ
jgi:hypothetical protein